jgi:hypothetical protein
MPVVFVIAHDSKLRVAVRAELRERGVEALGMESPDEAGRAVAAGEIPAAVVIEGIPEFTAAAAMQQLMKRVPAVVVSSRIDKISLPADPNGPADSAARDNDEHDPNRASQSSANIRGKILYRPVTVGQIVTQVVELLKQGYAA